MIYYKGGTFAGSPFFVKIFVDFFSLSHHTECIKRYLYL